MISVRRLAGTSSSFASARADRPSGIRYSSRRISPGWVRRRGISDSSVIIHDLDCFGAIWRPYKTDTPLLVDANGVLAPPIALQGFQPVAWRGAQVVQPRRGVHHIQFAQRYGFKTPPACRTIAHAKELFGGLVGKATDHD